MECDENDYAGLIATTPYIRDLDVDFDYVSEPPDEYYIDFPFL